MNTNFELYKIFYYVCRNMSITDAATKLYVSQPAISKQIKNLEQSLGIDLFIRDKKGIHLTIEGEKLYQETKDIIECLLLIPDCLNEFPKEIKIVAGYSTIKNYLISSLTKYNDLYPDINFELNSYRYHEAIDKLRNMEVDVIFINKKNTPNNDLEDLEVRKFLDIHDIFVINKDYLGLKEDVISVDDLDEYPIICKSYRSTAKTFLEEELSKIGLKFLPKFELSNNWLIEEYVRLNLGIGIVTKEFVLEELDKGDFIEVKTDFVLPTRELVYVVRKNYAHKNLVNEFVRDLKENFKI